MISVIICTRNRPDKISDCLNSIFKNSFSDFEIIVVDQSDNERTKKELSSFSSSKVRYFKLNNVERNWLSDMYRSFEEHKDTIGVFGKVLAYKPRLHEDEICPCIFFE